MFTYEDVLQYAKEIFDVDRLLDTFFLTSVLSGNPEQHSEATLKILSLGHDAGGRKSGRLKDENGRIQFQPNEIAKIGQDFMAVHIQAMSLNFSILSQIAITDMEKISRECVVMLFEIGYNLGMQPIVEEAQEPTPTPDDDNSDDLDDDMAAFLSQLL